MGENRNGPSPFQIKDERETPRDNNNQGGINLLEVVGRRPQAPAAPTDQRPAPPADRVSDRAETQPKAPPIDTAPLQETRQIITGIYDKMQQLSQLYEQKPDGSVVLRTGKIKDAAGREVEVAAVHAQLIGELARDYERAIAVSERGVVPQLEGATVAAKRDFDNQVAANRRVESELSGRGINLKDSNGLVSNISAENYLRANPNLPPADRAKVEELIAGFGKQQQLEHTLRDYGLLRMGPVACHNEYAKFLNEIGLPNAAARHTRKAEDWTNERTRPAEVARVSAQVRVAQEARVNPIVDKYLKSADNPFASVSRAHELTAQGKKDEARAALQEAQAKANRLPKAEIEADLKKLTEAAQAELKQMQADLEKKQKEGTLTPADVLNAAEREGQLNNDVAILQNFLLAKPKADLAYASFLLHADKNAGSEANRSEALGLLLQTRYDKYGKIAASQESEAFDKNLERAMSGPQDNQAKLIAYQEAMKKYDQLKQEAIKLEDNDEIVAKLKEARRQAEVAKSIAEGIDRGMADRSQQAIRKVMNEKIAEEQKKPSAEQDQGKIRLLTELAKPPYQQSKEIQDLVNEAFKDPAQQDKAKIARLEGMVKNKEELGDILAAHAELTRMEFMKQAVNQARVAVIELDCMFDDAEDHSYTKAIDNDPYGYEFKQSLNANAGKNVWGELKEATRDLAWYENAWKWFTGNIKDILISIAAGVSGFVVGTLVGGLSIWSGPGAVIAGGAAGFATGAAVGTGLHAAFGDKITPLGVVMNGIDGMSGGLMGAGRGVALKSGALALESLTGKAVATQGVRLTAGETLAAFGAAGLRDKIAIAAGTRFGAAMTGATLSSVGYRFGHEGVNFYAGKYDNFGDYVTSAGGMVLRDMPGNAVGAGIGLGFEKFFAWRAGVPMTASRFGFGDYMFAGPLNTQLSGKGYYRPPFVIERQQQPQNRPERK